MGEVGLYVSFAVLALGSLVLRTVYHLYLHPLSKFPGPRIAAATYLYEFYYDVVKGGMYIWEVERMHEKYGQYRVSITTSPSDADGHMLQKTYIYALQVQSSG